MVGKPGATDKQSQAGRLDQVPPSILSILQNKRSGGKSGILIHAFFQVVGAAVEEMLQPKLNGLKAKSN